MTLRAAHSPLGECPVPNTESPSLAERRAELARAARQRKLHPADPARAEYAAELHGIYKSEKIAAYIRAVVDDAPALTTEQVDRLVVLLRGAG